MVVTENEELKSRYYSGLNLKLSVRASDPPLQSQIIFSFNYVQCLLRDIFVHKFSKSAWRLSKHSSHIILTTFFLFNDSNL